MRNPRRVAAWALTVGMVGSTAAAVSAQEAGVDTITVALDGSGDFNSIAAAIDAANAGDSILIAPGEYIESLYIDKPLTLSGDGARDAVVIAPGDDVPQREVEFDGPSQVAVYVDGADVVIEHLTVSIPADFPIALIGGTSVIRDIVTDDTIVVRGDASVLIEDADLHSVAVAGPSEAVVRDNTIRESMVAFEGGRATVEGNLVLDMPIVAEGGGHLEVTGNTFEPNDDEPGVVIAEPESTGHVIGNEFSGGWVGVIVEYPSESLVEGNTIDGAEIGIVVVESGATIRDNTITAVRDKGIWTIGEGPRIEGNTIAGGRTGLHAESLPGEIHPRATDQQAGPFIVGNAITGSSHFGVVIEDVPAELSGNTICAGREPVKIAGEANLILGTNEICEVDEG